MALPFGGATAPEIDRGDKVTKTYRTAEGFRSAKYGEFVAVNL